MPNSYYSVIGMMLYLVSNTISDISFDVHQCFWFTHNTKASHETAMKRICRYLQRNKDNGLVFNLPKKLVAGCYSDACFAVLWENENTQDPICARIKTVLVVIFPIVLYCGCQNYRHRFIFKHYIMSMWHCLIMLSIASLEKSYQGSD